MNETIEEIIQGECRKIVYNLSIDLNDSQYKELDYILFRLYQKAFYQGKEYSERLNKTK